MDSQSAPKDPDTAVGDGQDKPRERAFYDKLFRSRGRFDQFQNEIYQRIAREARDRVGGGRALDLGCGAGTQARYLAEEGFEVTAMDLSLEGVVLTRRTTAEAGRRVQAVNADAEHLPVLTASIDACICGLLLHHFRDLQFIAGELNRVVRPGGVVVALDANAHNPPTWMFMNVVHRIRPLAGLTPNQRALTRGEITRVFAAAGFEEFAFESLTSALRRDWLGDSVGAKANYYTRATLLGLSNFVLPPVSRGNMLLSVFRRRKDGRSPGTN
jgi:ubiquinone/menaquinone biosynthesis C-methylase UbiE